MITTAAGLGEVTAVTEEVYRHQLKPVITRGAEAMNTIFKQNKAKSA